ncbi:MAG: homocysteine S-methyltransferase family protein [Desulfobacterales bacterium]|nr:homocysteine S-methyltransferase family protein [Desulfobacterales bacterium]
MDFKETLAREPVILTEGAVIERLKRETGVALDPLTLNTGLIYDPTGRRLMGDLYADYMKIGATSGLPMMTLTPTWRANPDRLAKAGLAHTARVNADAVNFLLGIRNAEALRHASIFTGGLMACQGDAYRPQEALSADSARTFHAPQAEALAAAGVDFLMAATLPAAGEALGLARAMAATGVAYIISFVLGADGALLDGSPLAEAIRRIDNGASPAPVGYMANCVHPAAFAAGLVAVHSVDPSATRRIMGLQANTSALPPDQLNDRKELDTMAPEAFAAAMADLHRRYRVKILGGCCGTDHAHIEALARSLAP